MAGSNKGSLARGTYGHPGLPAVGNTPGERMSTVRWTDPQGNLWLFGTGSGGMDAVGNYGFLDDVWEFNAAFQQWAWIAGSSTLPTDGSSGFNGTGGCSLCAVPPVFGTYQTASAAGTPGGLQQPLQWTDTQGNLWLFGGFEYRIIENKTYFIYLNALWKFDVSTARWAWMGGTSSEDGNAPGVYGTLGQAAPGNTPGARSNSATWTDAGGRLWIFGGNGQDAAGLKGELNDLWMFDPTTMEWTWMGGSNLLPALGGAPATFGTRGVAAAANTPPGLEGAFVWTGKDGSIWLFGGVDSIADPAITQSVGNYSDDLWKFDSRLHQWAWMGGSSKIDMNPLPGVYGVRGTAAPGNLPGARSGGYSWTDNSGNLWLFGGDGYDSTTITARLGDLWQYSTSTHLWTWMGGPTTFLKVIGAGGVPQNCLPGSIACSVPGVYGTLGAPAADNAPGARLYAGRWTDKAGGVWIFGGWGVDSVGTWGFLNDFWKFDPSLQEWTWMGGSSTVPNNGVNSGAILGTYGALGVFAAGNVPGSHSPAGAWNDADGNLWMFGGEGCNLENCYSNQNDLWEYQAYAPAAPRADFAIGISPGSLKVPAGTSGTSQLSTVVVNGFSSAIDLAVSAPSGISATLSRNPISGAGSSTITIAADAGAALGPYSVLITGTSGGLSHTISLGLDVISSTPAATPVFTPAAGSYSTTQTVSITDATPGAIIHFTTDGSTPTAASLVYSVPLAVSVSETLRAVALAVDYPDSAVATSAYSIVRTPFTNAYTPSSFATRGDPIGLQFADINDDGLPDIVYEDTTTNPLTIQSALAQRDGSFIPGPVLQLPDGTGVCRTLDANNDGRIDLACIQVLDDFDVQIAAFLGNGDGTFQPPIFSAPMQSCIDCNLAFLPWMFTPADINSDGNPDLLVGDDYDAWTYVLLGDGAGRFTISEKLTNIVSDASATDTVLDITGDGKPDLVNSVGPLVIPGKGDGTFAAPLQQALPYSGCVLRDMDGDGRVDAVCSTIVASNGTGTGSTELDILKGYAGGTFSTAPIATKIFGNPQGGFGKFFNSLAVTDLNGDGILDILAYSSDGLTVLLGQGGLKFADPVHYAAGYVGVNGELSSLFADVNYDGLLDVVAAGPDGIYFSYGRKDGTFGAPPAYEIASILGRTTVADFNGDGIPDIAATGDPNIELSLGKGDGTFQPLVPLANGGIDFSAAGMAGNAQIVHGDFNGDGHQDILAIGYGGNNQYDSYLLLGDGKGNFAAPQLVPGTSVLFPAFVRMSVLDIDKDGRDDILTSDRGLIIASLSKGDGTFTTVSSDVPANSGGLLPSDPAFADFNQDGKIDAVYGQGTDLYVVQGHGDGTFASQARILHIPSFQGQEPPSGQIAVTIGDFDGDGHTDIAALVQFELGAVPNPVYSATASIAFVYYGNGDGTFSAPVVAGVFNRIYSGIFAADLNKDGRSDLVYQTYEEPIPVPYMQTADSVGVQMSLPGRTFAQERHFNGGLFESGLEIADVNGDGFPDLLSMNGGFSPNGNYTTAPGNSVTELLSVGAPSSAALLPTSTVVVTSNHSVAAGAGVTFTATVANRGPAAGLPTGTVTFTDRTGLSSTVPLAAESLSSATATCTTSTLGIGTDIVNAVYSGDSAFAPSSGQVSQTITGYLATLSATVAPNPGIVGQPITVTGSVANGAGVTTASPTGYVEFSDSLTGSLGSGQVSKRLASADITLTAGVHTITAWYSGDALHTAASTTVSATALTETGVTIDAPASVLSSQDVAATILVSSGVGGTAPTGSVVLSSGAYTSAAAVLANGSAIITLPAGALPVGTDTLKAAYTPDAAASSNFLSSSASTVTIAVTQPPPSFSIAATSVSISPGATTGNTSTITIKPAYGFTGKVALSVVESSHPAGAVDPPALSFGASTPVTINGTTAGTATLTITTTPPTSAAAVSPLLPWSAGSTALACLILFGIPQRRRRWQSVLGTLLLLVALLSGVSACGGGGSTNTGGPPPNPGTTRGAYTFTVTGQSGTLTEAVTVSLTVQ